jgi:type IV secretory pathway VirB2 component (pilin)
MASVDGLLLLAALLCVLQFAVAVSYRFRRSHPSYHPAKEIIAHLTASVMVVMFIIASGMLNKPEFENFGIAMAVVMVIYYTLMSADVYKER